MKERRGCGDWAGSAAEAHVPAVAPACRAEESPAAVARPQGSALGGGGVWIVIPARDAERTLAAAVSRIAEPYLDQLLIIDDGSIDGTAHEIEAIQRRWRGVESLGLPNSIGYARVQKLAFDRLRRRGASAVVLLHADGQYPAERIGDLLAPIRAGRADCVFGSRMRNGMGAALRGGMPLYKAVGNRLLTAIENHVSGLRLSEYHSGFIAYSRSMLDRTPYQRLSDSFHFDGEMLLMAHHLGVRIEEIAIPCHYGDETSHLKPLRYLRSVLKAIRREHRGVYAALARSSLRCEAQSPRV